MQEADRPIQEPELRWCPNCGVPTHQKPLADIGWWQCLHCGAHVECRDTEFVVPDRKGG